MKNLLIVLFFLFSTIGVFAQDKYLKNITETEAISKNATKLFSEGKISEAFDMITPYWPLPKNEMDAIEEKTVKYINIINQRFGEPIRTLKLKTETIADIAIRETYIIQHKFSAVRLIFTYYKNNQGWLINSFKWDDSFTDEFKEE